MSARFGRNQRRKLIQRISELEEKQWGLDLSAEAVHLMREACQEGLGVNCTFVDDNMSLLVGLAQRAVLAGLDTDAQPDMQRRFREAAEPHRAAHESAIGRAISQS